MFLQPNPHLDLMGENLSIIFALLTIFFMIKTRPRRTEVYIYDLLGMILSAVEVALHVIILLYPTQDNFNHNLYLFVSIIYHVFYMIILNLIYAYVWLLSYKQRLRKKVLLLEVLIFDAVYVSVYTVLFKYSLIFYVEDGIFYAGDFFNFFMFFGIADAIMTLLTGVKNKKDIPKTIFLYVMMFGSIDIAVLIGQLLKPNIIFSSITFVAPFLIYYLLFHSNPMDEVSGCRNLFAFETVYAKNRRTNRNCAVLYGTIKNLPTDFLAGYNDRISYMVSEKCRKIEALSKSLKIYTTDPTTYMAFVYEKGEAREEIIRKIGDIISEPVVIGNSVATVNYKLFRVENVTDLKNVNSYISFINFLSRTHKTDIYTNQYYIATDDDYQKYATRSVIADALLDIRKNRDLDDERVLCFAQPIHSVSEDKFKTAESLMRMKIDGKMYFPDSFIPVAEETNCIHVLTLIMINKVCKKIKELEVNSDFECITVNCSTLEFADSHFADEVLEIIDNNDVSRSKIRLELTESSVSSYNSLMNNMTKLRDAGIAFYLDDFGTGYSNIDRILTCPFKTVKFDKSILYKALADNAMYSVTEGMVKALKQKGYLTLVEGVEDENQRDKCVEIGFEYIQGYFYSKPVPIDELANYFESF